ncbi:ras-related protein Rab-27B-like isoform X2 [Styela clava]|uniref:ras-related protein Rab-27B-like isoform X2 n=1 Tax=Styela clava TaxID=7725 RepID=UPI00193A3733|nr:ras-related protein Rab-27B-like isoform X2 [Styela clava]
MASSETNSTAASDDILDSNYDFLIKFMLLGDSGVGKTCFLHRYMEGEFRSRFTATVGVDFRLKKLEYDFPEDDGEEVKKKIHLQIWDTAGQERYRSLTKAFFRDGMGFLLLFDVGNVETFHSVRDWLSEIKEEAYCENPDIILIGNKCDLENRAVSEKQGQQLANELNVPYMETSAATGNNVTKAINTLLDMVMKRMRDYVSGMDPKTGKSGEPGNVGPETKTETQSSSSCAC